MRVFLVAVIAPHDVHGRPPSDFVTAYAVDECRYVDELPTFFPVDGTLLRLHGKNSDSGSVAEPAAFDGVDKFNRDDTTLFPHIVELRVIKTALELDVLRYVAGVSSAAHTQVMREVRPGMME